MACVGTSKSSALTPVHINPPSLDCIYLQAIYPHCRCDSISVIEQSQFWKLLHCPTTINICCLLCHICVALMHRHFIAREKLRTLFVNFFRVWNSCMNIKRPIGMSVVEYDRTERSIAAFQRHRTLESHDGRIAHHSRRFAFLLTLDTRWLQPHQKMASPLRSFSSLLLH